RARRASSGRPARSTRSTTRSRTSRPGRSLPGSCSSPSTMFDPDPAFRPVRRRDGYLPLEDLGLIGDGETAALVGIDGSIPWLCLPRFDSDAVFCGLLDHAGGGHFTIAPAEPLTARQRYEPDTAVLTTEMTCATGVVRLTDAFALRPGADLT